jgi:hypothetical protein
VSFAWPSGEPDLWKDDRAWKAELAREWDLGYALVDNSCAWFGTRLGRQGIAELVRHSSLRVFQAEVPPRSEQWKLLNEEFFSQRPDVKLRVYGRGFDLDFLRYVPNVRRFSADGVRSVKNVEAVGLLPNLEELGIGIWELKDFTFLNEVREGLRGLSLGETSSKVPSLAVISRFKELRQLFLEGQQRDIESISTLDSLEDMTLRSISTPTIDYVLGLDKLWSLDVKLGGIKDFSALRRMPSIKYLELWQIKGLSDLSFISDMVGLQHLLLQSLGRVTELPDLSKLRRLRRIHLDTMKALINIDSLESAPSLQQVLVPMSWRLKPADFRGLLTSPTLTHLAVGFRGDKNRSLLQAMVNEAGKIPKWPKEFSYL